MRPALLSLLCLLTACGGLRAKGDAAFERGDHRLAASYYHALLTDKGLTERQLKVATWKPARAARLEREGKLSPEDHRDTLKALRAAMRHVWTPTVEEAQALFEDGYTVLALQLVAVPCEPGGRYRLRGEVVPGACDLVAQIVQRLAREASGGEIPDFTHATRAAAAVARAFSWRPPPALSEPLEASVRAAVEHAQAEGHYAYAYAWMASLARAKGLTPSERTGQFKIPYKQRTKPKGKLMQAFNSAAGKMATEHRARSRAAQGARPWLAQVHAGLAKLGNRRQRSYGAVTGGVDLAAGAVRGACAAEAQRALSPKDPGPRVVLDLNIRDCRRFRETRTRRKRKVQAYTQKRSFTVRDPIHRYEMQEVCEDVSVCSFLQAKERGWLTWNECLREHVRVERRCKQVRVKVGTDWSAPRKVTSRQKKYRTVTVDQPYTVHRWTFDAQVTARVGGRSVRYRVKVDETGPDARSLGFKGWRRALTALATHEALVRALRGQRAADPVDELARRLVAGQPLTTAEFYRLSEAAGAPVWVLAEAFDAVDRDSAVTLHRMALADAPKAVDWTARWADVPSWTSKADGSLDGLTESVHIPPKLLARLREVELEQLPDVRWRDVLYHRVAISRTLPKED